MSAKTYRAYPLEDGKPKVELVEGRPEAKIPCVVLYWNPAHCRERPWPDEIPGWRVMEYQRFNVPRFLIELREKYPDAIIETREARTLGWQYPVE